MFSYHINGKVNWKNSYICNPSFFNDRKFKYDKITKFFDEREINSLGACEITQNLKILQRIGSESKSAEVFLLNIKEINESVAIKVLPIINRNSYDKNENEIRIAINASNLVLEGSSIYFPIVYNLNNQDCLCENTIFYSDNFNLKSQDYQRRKNSYKSHILLSELAKEDLYTYLYKNQSKLNDELILNLINQCLKAINDLHNKLNVIHNDLHLRNFLIFEYENNIIPLIHDFGSSEFVNKSDISLYDYDKLDINFFFENFLELDFLSENLKNKIQKMI